MSNNDSSSNFTQTPSANHGMKALSQLLPVAIAITLANGLVLALFYRKKRLRTQSNYLLLSLAICDLLTGTINIPYFIVYSFQVVTSTMFVNFLYIVHTLMAVSAAYHILTITAEKYLAIMKPLRHRLVTKTTVFKCLAGIWMISTFIAVITLVWNESSSRLLWYIIHSVFCLVFVFFIPYVFMIYAFARMFRKITKRQRSSSVHRGTSRLQQNDQKCILVFATMAAIFVLCWLPYFTLMLILNINDYLESGPSLSLNSQRFVAFRCEVNNHEQQQQRLSFKFYPDTNWTPGYESVEPTSSIAIVITLANGLVLTLFYRRKRLRTQSNYLLLSLAICDFLTGTISIPCFIVYSFQVVTSTMFFNFLYIVHTLMAVSAAYHILTTTAEKYLAIMKPLRHRLVTKTTVFKGLVGIWMISTFVAVIPLVWSESSSQFLWYIIHSAVCLVFVFFIPYVFMIYAFTSMFRAITKRQRPSSVIGDTPRLQQNDLKCILVFATMAAIFVLCWLPYFTLMLILNINLYLNSVTSVSTIKAIQVFAIMRYMTSIMNPLLYTYFKRDFWFEIRNLCRSSTSERRRRSRELTTKLSWTARSSNKEHVTDENTL
ncbi:hypothetical protein OS493_023930 [Desmophyllum pertusum]|uniref:G-protein coupled receptors family 1 profile domain-containing protein n=1 Tax=Desmophyllum pertusum TaxID=174260 RepID=A0A9X0CE11_9CNID|nr:hypothetical protein OS493_023930 [Desmophyllum pertusum]